MQIKQRKIKLEKAVAFGSNAPVTELNCKLITTAQFLDSEYPFTQNANGVMAFDTKLSVKYVAMMTGIDYRELVTKFNIVELSQIKEQIVPFLLEDLGEYEMLKNFLRIQKEMKELNEGTAEDESDKEEKVKKEKADKEAAKKK